MALPGTVPDVLATKNAIIKQQRSSRAWSSNASEPKKQTVRNRSQENEMKGGKGGKGKRKGS
ncbi:hypothetical protein PHLCEN_2v3801 [Hermanssonia centrifuga]|uniref:Uncharacterized protein n=1 Tax=Hermanssonia centrifuga TaxID=98765 RepID=A0A2R6QBL8_9APHY|nr:hypothetical protein PHLCEN_2v3801 [Hermanssonia centrifuga]